MEAGITNNIWTWENILNYEAKQDTTMDKKYKNMT